MRKIKLFISYLLIMFSNAAVEAVNAASSEDELDELVLQKVGFKK